MFQKFIEKYLWSILFCIGLSLTVWRSFECLQKYSYENLSTKVTMMKGTETLMPSFVLCPAAEYNLRALQNIGVKSGNDYQDGDFFGNSSIDERIALFERVTYNLTDLINSIKIGYKSGKMVDLFKEDFDSFKPVTISNIKYGRCYDLILFDNVDDDLYYVKFQLVRDLEIYVDIPHHFYTNTRSRIFANASENLYMKVSYEILKINHDKNCKKYAKVYSGSYDECKETDMEDKILATLNCSVPSMRPSENICMGSEGERASKMYMELFSSDSTKCPPPCNKMIPVLGMPKQLKEDDDGGTATAKLYFDSIVKVTEDFISYDLLSMVAEIGGYSGLLIGFSLMDLAMVCNKAVQLIKF